MSLKQFCSCSSRELLGERYELLADVTKSTASTTSKSAQSVLACKWQFLMTSSSELRVASTMSVTRMATSLASGLQAKCAVVCFFATCTVRSVLVKGLNGPECVCVCVWLSRFVNRIAISLCGIAHIGCAFAGAPRRMFVGLDGDFTVRKSGKQPTVQSVEPEIDNGFSRVPCALQTPLATFTVQFFRQV